MKTKLEKGSRYLAAGIFFMALLLNVKFTLDSPYFISGSELIAQTTGTGTDTGTGTGTGTFFDSFSSWWGSKIYYCEADQPCMGQVEFAMNAGGSWGVAGGTFTLSITKVSLPGTREFCREGNQVAHCWNCNTQCVVSMETINQWLNNR